MRDVANRCQRQLSCLTGAKGHILVKARLIEENMITLVIIFEDFLESRE